MSVAATSTREVAAQSVDAVKTYGRAMPPSTQAGGDDGIPVTISTGDLAALAEGGERPAERRG